ncbi:zinc finger FYVE domain-containing protein 9 [Ciona intestinalis]
MQLVSWCFLNLSTKKMDDPFFSAAPDLDKLLDELEVTEAQTEQKRQKEAKPQKILRSPSLTEVVMPPSEVLQPQEYEPIPTLTNHNNAYSNEDNLLIDMSTPVLVSPNHNEYAMLNNNDDKEMLAKIFGSDSESSNLSSLYAGAPMNNESSIVNNVTMNFTSLLDAPNCLIEVETPVTKPEEKVENLTQPKTNKMDVKTEEKSFKDKTLPTSNGESAKIEEKSDKTQYSDFMNTETMSEYHKKGARPKQQRKDIYATKVLETAPSKTRITDGVSHRPFDNVAQDDELKSEINNTPPAKVVKNQNTEISTSFTQEVILASPVSFDPSIPAPTSDKTSTSSPTSYPDPPPSFIPHTSSSKSTAPSLSFTPTPTAPTTSPSVSSIAPHVSPPPTPSPPHPAPSFKRAPNVTTVEKYDDEETYSNQTHMQLHPEQKESMDDISVPASMLHEASNSKPEVHVPPAVRIMRPGRVRPAWVPDDDSAVCSQCQLKFTFTRRRHHCRACGKVFCSSCCSEKAKLEYMEYAVARVCVHCFVTIQEADVAAAEALNKPTKPTLKSPDDPTTPSHSKSVRFSDGTKPTHPTTAIATPPMPRRAKGRSAAKNVHVEEVNPEPQFKSSLPPILQETEDERTYALMENPDMEGVTSYLWSLPPDPLCFVISSNLCLLVKVIKYGSGMYYYVLSMGLDSVGQSEVAFIISAEEEDPIPLQIFMLYRFLFTNARKGKPVHCMDLLLTSEFLNSTDEFNGSKDYAGLLFVRHTCQDIDVLQYDVDASRFYNGVMDFSSNTVQFSSTLFALLISKSEVPWAKLFPTRLLCGLGAQFKYYPCPLVNEKIRKPIYGNIGNTILGILCDFRNYKYQVISVQGMTVVVKNSNVTINLPCNRFSDITKILNSSNDHVLALGADVMASTEYSSSILTCVQNPNDSSYQTEVLYDGPYEEDSSTAASFVVFNGSLKSSHTQLAKSTIVEDGIMVQLLPEKMELLRSALKAMEDFEIDCGHLVKEEEKGGEHVPRTSVCIQWISDDTKFNIGLSSPIDYRALEGVIGYNIQGKSEKKDKHFILRWNQVFFYQCTNDATDMGRLAEQMAQGCFQALVPHLSSLRKRGQLKIGIRINVHPDEVGYSAGSLGVPLPDKCLKGLDDHLIPLVNEATCHLQAFEDPVVFELIFYILEMQLKTSRK